MREQILRRLQTTVPADDPAAEAIDALPVELARRLQSLRLVPAAVLVPLVERPAGLQLLLTQRTDALRDHAGQVSFPGGRVEPGDADALATALREAEEEVGLPAGRVQIAGFLRPQAVVTGFVITPVVGLVPGDIQWRTDPREVAAAFEVPLDFFRQPANRQRSLRHWQGIDFPVEEYRIDNRRIWGATAQIIGSLLDTLFI